MQKSKLNTKNFKFINGFTLVELLVVVALIAMILAFVSVQFKESRARARDAKREANMKDLQNALNIYANAVGLFPRCEDETVVNGKDDCLSSLLLGERVVSAVPVDPIGGSSGSSCNATDFYIYCYQSADGTSYSLRYRLETNTIPGKSAGWQIATP